MRALNGSFGDWEGSIWEEGYARFEGLDEDLAKGNGATWIELASSHEDPGLLVLRHVFGDDRGASGASSVADKVVYSTLTRNLAVVNAILASCGAGASRVALIFYLDSRSLPFSVSLCGHLDMALPEEGPEFSNKL
jgi:hypothetical protein